ncbi:MAG: hypothetical protein J7521_16275 [Caulobacter sp.]|nr:hypothetical protein [Caulobacter sp.]
MAKAAAKTDGPAPAAAPKGKKGKGPKPRTIVADLMTCALCVGCAVWAFKVIVALGAQSF